MKAVFRELDTVRRCHTNAAHSCFNRSPLPSLHSPCRPCWWLRLHLQAGVRGVVMVSVHSPDGKTRDAAEVVLKLLKFVHDSGKPQSRCV